MDTHLMFSLAGRGWKETLKLLGPTDSLSNLGTTGVSGAVIYTYIHTHKIIYTYIHTHIHTYIQTYTHTYIQTYIHTYIHTHIHTHTYM